jgi:predicted transcriptional regulator
VAVIGRGTNLYGRWYRHGVSTNLRLSEELAVALRQEAIRRGRSQQEIVREAVAKELGLASDLTAMQRAVRSGLVEAAEPFRDIEPTLTLPKGTSSSLDLLDREDR